METQKITFTIDKTTLEMVGDFQKKAMPSIKRSGVLRVLLDLGLSKAGYSRTNAMDESELMALNLKSPIPKWIRRHKLE